MNVRRLVAAWLALALCMSPMSNYVYAEPGSGDSSDKVAASNKTESLDLEYGTDKTIDVSKYVTKDYDGDPTASSSSKTVSVRDMTVTILSAGNAVVTIDMPETDKFEADKVTVNMKIAKKDIGELQANQVNWASVEKAYDGSDTMNLSGTVKEGIESSDEVTVTATATADGAGVGSHSTTLSNISFSGDANYNISLNENGPDINIVKKDLNTITSDMIDWDSVSKVYDGSATLQVSGTVKKDSGIEPDDNITVTATATAESADAGTHASSLSNISIEGTDNYSLTVSKDGPDITITPKDLGNVDASAVEWSNTSKTYDGSKTVSVSGKFSGIEGMAEGDEVTLSAEVSAKSKDVGTHTSVIDSVSFQDMNNYTASITGAGPEVTIQAKDATISLKDQNVVYGDDNWKLVRDKQELPWDIKAMIESDLDDALQNELLKEDITSAVSATADKDDLHVGTRTGILHLTIKNDAVGNFHLLCSDPASDIIVAQESMTDEAAWSHVVLENADECGVYMSDDKVLYVRPGASAVFGNDLDRYDKTFVKQNSGLYNGTLSIDPNAKDGEIAGNLYFGNSASADTRSSENNIPKGKAFIDGSYPDVSFENSISILNTLNATDGSATFKETIRFEKYLKDGYTVKVSSSDASSGMEKTEYALVKITSQKDAETKITQCIQSGKWTAVPDSRTIDVPGDKKGYYVVCVRAEDKVGNAAVYTSTGLVIEATAPSVTIEGIKDGKIYAGDVPYTIKVSDAGDVASGLADVDVSVYCDGKDVGNAGSYMNSFELKQSDLDALNGASGDTFEAIQKRSGLMTLNASVLAADCNSNDIEIVAKVTDKSGNVVSVAQRVMIDTTAPVVTVSYDDNNAKHEKYFNRNRTMTVEYNERNFDENSAPFTITVNGTKQTYTIADIRSGKVADVSLSGEKRDTESGRSVHAYTDERVIAYDIQFGTGKTDIDYSVVPAITDLAGNVNNGVNYAEGTTAGVTFTIDEVAPVLSMVFINGSGEETKASTSKASPLYDRSKITVRLQAEERNFLNKLVKVDVNAWNAKNMELQVYSGADAPSKGNWSRSGVMNTFTMPVFSKDANYSINGAMEDLAGNEATYRTRYFTVDQTPPTGKILVQNKNNNSESDAFWSKVRFWLFDRVGFGVTHTEDDATSGIDSVRYYIWHPDVNSRRQFSGIRSGSLGTLDWKAWISELRLNPDSQSIVYMRVTDKAGNVTYINTRDGVISEATAPQITIAIDNEKQIFNRDVPFTITVTDPEKGDTYAGLKSVTYTVTSAGKRTQSGSYDTELSDRTARVKSISHKETVNAKNNNSNHVVIQVTATDYSGNTTTAKKEIKIDVTPPKIEVTYNLNDPKNGKYYNKVRVATVRIMERNFDPNKVNFNITSTGTRPKISGWTSDGKGGESNNSVNTCTVTFDDSADYTFTLSCTDRANNMSSYTRKDEFTVDLINPEITVSYDNNKVANGHYFNKARIATVTVREHNFNASDFTKQIYATLEDAGIKAPDITGWRHSGDTHTTSIPFRKDGDYRFDLHFTDLAGNNAKDFHQDTFTVDTTLPDVSISNVENKHAYNGVVSPIVVFEDVNLDDNISISTKGAKHAVNNVSKEAVSNGRTGSLQVPDLPHTVENDDIYTLNVVIKDLAGNKTEEQVVYSVNRFGSNFTFSDETAKLFDTYYLNKENPLVIYETNVSSLTEQKVSLSRDGSIVNLTKDTDYTSKVEDDSAGWKVYEYTINKENFKQEGLYEVMIQSVDEAGNKQDNRIKQAEMQLVIDKTAPSAIVSGIENKGRYKEAEREIRVTVNDNVMPKSLTIMKDQHILAKFEEGAFKDSSISYMLGAENDWQNISVVAEDMAGNQYISEPMRVLVTPVGWRQYIHNPAAVAATVAAAAAAITGIILFLRKRKKEAEEE